jgi:hypothetical protein
MPSVSKNELLQVVREVWGYAGAPTDDQAKMVLAEALIREAWEQGNKCDAWLHSCISICRRGQPSHGLLPVCRSSASHVRPDQPASAVCSTTTHWIGCATGLAGVMAATSTA